MNKIPIVNKDEFTAIRQNSEDGTTFVDLETGKRLFINLPLSIVTSSLEELKHVLEGKKFSASVAEEGTAIRVFYNRGRWYTASKRKLQVFNSSWADNTTTFGASFAQAVRNELDMGDDDRLDRAFLEWFYETYLDKSCVYFFLLRNTKGERIVCDPPANIKSMHICTQTNGVNDFDDRIPIEMGTFTHTVQIKPCFVEIQNQLNRLHYRDHQGVIIESSGVFYKIFIPEYAKLFNLRGATASLKMCYLTLRAPDRREDREIFLDLYPEFKDTVEWLETDIYLICWRLHHIYLDKYIGKRYVSLTSVDTKALKIIHTGYLTHRIPTTPRRINDLLTAHPIVLNHLLKQKHIMTTMDDVD